MNALEHVVIPKFVLTLIYIIQELDEQAKEDFFRLKKVMDNKRKHAEEAEKILEMNEGKLGEKAQTNNLLDDVDEDIIF